MSTLCDEPVSFIFCSGDDPSRFELGIRNDPLGQFLRLDDSSSTNSCALVKRRPISISLRRCSVACATEL